MEVAVIGAGVIGASVERSLVRRGDDVIIIESNVPGCGTSRTSFAWVNANTKEPLPYFALNRAGMHAHRELASAGPTPWWYPTGNLEWASSPGDLARLEMRVSRLQDRDYAAQRLSADEAAELEPDLRLPGAPSSFAYFPDEAYCFPMPLLAHLLGEARVGGARLRFHTAVSDIETHPNGVRVVLADASDVRADAAVCCTGRWTSQLLGEQAVPMLGPERQEAATLGYLATTAPAPTRLSRVLTTPSLNVRPAGGGRLLLQALDLDPAMAPDAVPSADSPVARTMLRRAQAVLPGVEGTDIDDLQLGRRAMPADGLTVSGFVDETESRLYAVATHSGITLGPLLGDLVAQELHGQTADMLDPFRPGRFNAGELVPIPTRRRRAGEQ